MALFAVMTFAGPGISPSIAGFLQLTEDWRWSFYILLMFGGATCILLFTIPETHPATVLTNKARRIRRLKIPGYENVQSPYEASGQTLTGIFKIALTRPWIILFDPISLLVALYISVTYCLLYMLFTIYPIVFRQKRGWNSGVSELPLIGTVVGAAIGGFIVFLNSRKQARKIARGEPTKPEDRLPLAQLGGIGFTVTMFWFGWTANFNSVHWFVPTLAGVFLATSIVLIFVSFLSYLTDTYLMYAASAIAANTVARSAAGAAAPLFTSQMFKALGVGGGASLIGGVAALLAVIPFAFYRYGEKIRIRSKFAPTTPKDDEESQDSQQEKEKQPSAEPQHTRSGSSSSDMSSSASSTVHEPDIEKQERSREQNLEGEKHDSDQNGFGEPRTENVNFGKQSERGI